MVDCQVLVSTCIKYASLPGLLCLDQCLYLSEVNSLYSSISGTSSQRLIWALTSQLPTCFLVEGAVLLPTAQKQFLCGQDEDGSLIHYLKFSDLKYTPPLKGLWER